MLGFGFKKLSAKIGGSLQFFSCLENSNNESCGHYFIRSVKVLGSIYPEGNKSLQILLYSNTGSIGEFANSITWYACSKPRCSLYYLTGEIVESGFALPFGDGEYRKLWNVSKFGTGIFMVVVEINGKAYCRKLVVN